MSPDDLAELVREERERGMSESTIVVVIGVMNRIYRTRLAGWGGAEPIPSP